MSVLKEFSPINRILLFSQFFSLKKRNEKKNRMLSATMSHQPLQLCNTQVFPCLCSSSKGEDYLLMTHINPCTAWLQSIINSGLFVLNETSCTHNSSAFELLLCTSGRKSPGNNLVLLKMFCKSHLYELCSCFFKIHLLWQANHAKENS